jgi:SnoaL-like domain
MSTDTRLEQLQRDVRYLLDRQAILDCIARHARGHDRHDVELLANAYHQDGVDEHGHAINAGPKYAQWANGVHAAGSRLHLHNITTHLCDIEGDVAHCESYVLVGLLNNDEKSARLINGRYIDRLERRDGEWKIALRRCTVDLLISGDASILKAPIFVEQGYIKGMRDKRDLCYQRPLKLDETPADRW